ncbi:MAG: dolichyl-phosphate beta-glucosyltransferase [Frankia sp.]
MNRVLVSIVIPAYNEAHRLPRSMAKLVPFVAAFGGAEVIVVDDGSTDGTVALAERFLRDLPQARILRLPWNSGKGSAVRAGVAMARGESIVFMDADMASDLEDLPRLLAALADAEIAVGSRRVGDGATRNGWRKAGSWGFNQIIRSLTSLDHADTQCGFKAFRHAEAKLLFSMSRATGFGFDVEILALARMLGYRTAEVPIRWDEVDGGRFNLIRHTPAMIVDAARAGRLSRRAPHNWSLERPAEESADLLDASFAASRPSVTSRAFEEQGSYAESASAAEEVATGLVLLDRGGRAPAAANGNGALTHGGPIPHNSAGPHNGTTAHNAGIHRKATVTGVQREVV